MTWPLVACDQAQPTGQMAYRTTEGERAVSWELKVWNANRSTLLNTITNSAAGGLSGGFRWQLQPNGDTVQLEFAGRNDRVKLPPRGVVQLRVDGQAAFYGIVPDPPSGGSPDVEQAQVLGGREALRKTLLDGKVYRDLGVYAIVRDVLSRLCPPSLTYLPSLIGDGSGTDAGPTLSTYYAPTSDLVTALDSLAKSAGTTWGVDSQGRIFFGRPSPAALQVAYAAQPWRRLRVQGRETVTRAVLRVVTTAAGVAPSSVNVAEFEPNGSGGYLAVRAGYLPMTVATISEHPQHALYRAETSIELPEGVGVIRPHPPFLTGNYQGDRALGSPEATIDGDPSTEGQNVGSQDAVGQSYGVNRGGDRVVGVRLTYRLAPEDARLVVRLQYAGFVPGGLGHTTNGFWELGPSGTTTVDLILPPHAKTQPEWNVNIEIEAHGLTAPGQFGLSEVAALRVDEAAALTVAHAALQPPFASPAEITLPGLLAPTPDATVTNSPDGTVSGPTSLWEYEHTPEHPRVTRVRLGSDGQSETARAIKFAVRGG